MNGRSPRMKIIVDESAFGDSVKIQGQKQSETERQKGGSISEYLLRHCHIVTVSTARLPDHALRMSLYV